MIGNEDISKTLRMMHEAARFEFDANNTQKGIDILNNARILEERMGFKNQACESMLEIANAYLRLNNYDLALWFAEEVKEKIPTKNKTSTLSKTTILLQTIMEKTNSEVLVT
jgi:hypothetical protein